MAGENGNMRERYQSQTCSKMPVITYKRRKQQEQLQLVVINPEIVRDEASIEDEAMYNGDRALIELSQDTPGGLCKVCNEVEKPDKRFLICGYSLCAYKFYHVRCLKPEQIAISEQQGNEYWYCPSCLCRVCKLNRDDEQIILCDGCDEGYHLYCLIPPLTSVPEGQWHCSSCIVQEEKEAKRRFYEQKILRLHRKDIATNVSMFDFHVRDRWLR